MIRSDHHGHKTSGQVEGRWEGRKRKEENENHIYGIDWFLFLYYYGVAWTVIMW